MIFTSISLHNYNKILADSITDSLKNTDFIHVHNCHKYFTIDKSFFKHGSSQYVYKIYDEHNKSYIIKFYFDNRIKEYMTAFKKKYKNDKQLFGKIVPKVYYYGSVVNIYESNYIKDSDTCMYQICKHYNTDFNFTFIDSLYVLQNLLNSLMLIHQKYHYIYDLKMNNIGCDKHNNVVIIDYDIDTFYKYLNNNDFTLHDYYAGSYNSNYILSSIKEERPIRLSYANKIEMTGFLEILLELLFENVRYGSNVANLLVMFQLGEQFTIDNILFDEIKKCDNDLYCMFSDNLLSEKLINQSITHLKPKYKNDNKKEYYDSIKEMIYCNNRGILSTIYDFVPSYYTINTSLTKIKNDMHKKLNE